jgi:hypothetical protein
MLSDACHLLNGVRRVDIEQQADSYCRYAGLKLEISAGAAVGRATGVRQHLRNHTYICLQASQGMHPRHVHHGRCVADNVKYNYRKGQKTSRVEVRSIAVLTANKKTLIHLLPILFNCDISRRYNTSTSRQRHYSHFNDRYERYGQSEHLNPRNTCQRAFKHETLTASPIRRGTTYRRKHKQKDSEFRKGSS